jgi:hypothetical protein
MVSSRARCATSGHHQEVHKWWCWWGDICVLRLTCVQKQRMASILDRATMSCRRRHAPQMCQQWHLMIGSVCAGRRGAAKLSRKTLQEGSVREGGWECTRSEKLNAVKKTT